MRRLTKKQQDIADFIETYLSEKKISPSFREIKEHFGFSSLGTVYNFIRALKQKKILSETKGVRALCLHTNTKPQCLDIPLVGKLCGKTGIEMFPHLVTIALPLHMISSEGEHYLLQIEGKEFTEEYIQPKDLILVEPRSHFEENELLIATIDQALFIKRGFSEPPYMRLESVNPHIQPLILREENVKVQGVVVSLIRNF